MARGIAYWYGLQVDEKEQKTELQGLVGSDNSLDGLRTDLIDTPSEVASWRLWAFVTAVMAWIQDVYYDQFKVDVQKLVDARSYGHSLWWVDEMKQFQYGDALQVVEVESPLGFVKVIDYATKDESKQIIKFVAVTKATDGTALIKVAKDDGSGLPTVLSTNELNAAKSYVIDWKQIAGAKLSVISLLPDLVKYEYDFYYNPQLDLEGIVKPAVEQAVIDYHQKLSFDGTVVLERLEDELQKVNGWVDHRLKNAEARPNGGSFSEFNRVYTTSSGYVQVDGAFPLSATINYIAGNAI